ncbi:MAG: response regulator [Archangiaceae bacterium]|nr:response regulator [Archangiaceae bacterium]
MNGFLRWLDEFSRASSFPDERGRMQARFVVVGSVLGGIMSLTSTLLLFVWAKTPQVLQSGIGFALCLTMVGLWRATLNRDLVSHLAGVVLSISYLFGAFNEQNLSTSSLFAIIPVLALFLSGRRVGGLWLVLVMVQMGLVGALLRPEAELERQMFDAQLVRVFVLAPTIFLIGFLYESGHERTIATLNQAREAAEAANREKSRFLAKVSHEIRTPLNGVLGTTELALLDDVSPSTREQLATIHRSGGTLLALINDLLDHARVESGRFELQSTPFLPAQVVTEIVDLNRARAQAKGLSLTVVVEVPASLRLLGDAVRLKQVLGNLVTNAIKFTPAGTIVVRAEGQPEGARFRLRLSVSDTGPGIGAADQGRLFLPFSQLSADTEGTGLGLAISRQLVEAMNGRLLLSSEVGKGSTFTLEVTLSQTDLNPQHTPASSSWRFSGRALVVDDNTINVGVAAGLLTRLGLEVQSAANGAEALDVLSKHQFDLVLMDLQMPVLDGLSATRAVRARGDATPIVALTANAMQEELQACLEAGMTDCLTKPLRLQRLVELLLRVLPAPDKVRLA